MHKKLSIFLIAFLFFASSAHARNIVKDIAAEGSCAIVGMSAEQCQLTALQRARAAAIEEAAGVAVSSSTLVTNFTVAADFIKTYSKGFIVKERAQWLPLGQYQKNPSTPPIPEYRVKIIADISVPEPKIKPIGLKARTNSVVYKDGEKAWLEVNAGREARFAVFNFTADDKVIMLFPNGYEKWETASKKFVFPAPDSKTELIMNTLPDHKRDAEALFVTAVDIGHQIDFSSIFTPFEPMSFSEFFKRFSDVADFCEDVILTYEVAAGEK